MSIFEVAVTDMVKNMMMRFATLLLCALTVLVVTVDAGGRKGAQAENVNSDSHAVTYVGIPFYQVMTVLGISVVLCIVISFLSFCLLIAACKQAYVMGQRSTITNGADTEAASVWQHSSATVRAEVNDDAMQPKQACEVEFFRQKAPKVKKPKKALLRKRLDQAPLKEVDRAIEEEQRRRADEVPTSLLGSMDSAAPIHDGA